MKVICVDNSNRPSDVPLSLWPILQNKYTVIDTLKDMHMVEYYKLEELDLASIGSLYKGYAASRFKPVDNVDGIVLEDKKELVC